MSETKIDERGASGEARDYSRPVGWWCPVCDRQHRPDVVSVDCPQPIPVYLPIPEGQRPLVEDEVESAEVVTLNDRQLPAESIWYASNETTMVDFGLAGIRNGLGVPINLHLWDASRWRAYITTEINRIAQASARARIVTGATE